MYCNFMTISLIFGCYKIIPKLLANRLSVVLGSLILDFQPVRVLGGEIHGCILLRMNLLIASLKKETHGPLFKLDLKKVFDCVLELLR